MFRGLFLHNLQPVEIRVDMKMKDLCEAERPRERLLTQGPEALSRGELLAVILRTGSGDKNALDLARDILARSGDSLVELSVKTADYLRSISGIGAEKAAGILAVFEIARRWMIEENTSMGMKVYDAQQAYHAMAPRMRGLAHEEFWVMFMKKNKTVINIEMMTKGVPGMVPIESASIVKRALELNANSVIAFHNHPSGDPEPSLADLKSTEELNDALKAMGKVLLDHIIITDDGYFSFAEDS